MGYRGGPQIQAMMPMTRVVKRIVIATVVIWLVLQVIVEQLLLNSNTITTLFGLQPGRILQSYFVWQLVTYMFLHDLNVFHILFNMLVVWWIGSELETHWGARFFGLYYFVCGIGAALIYTFGASLYALYKGNLDPLYIPVIGASGSVFGLMLAYGLIFGERIVYFMFIFPMKAKFFVMIMGGMEVVMLLNQGVGGSRVANLAHLGGLVAGFLFLLFWTHYNRWKRRQKPSSTNGRRLRLVVDNEDFDKRDPRYNN